MEIKKGTKERSLLDSIKGIEKDGKKWLITLVDGSGNVKVVDIPELQGIVDRMTKTMKTDPKKSPLWLKSYMQTLSREKEYDRIGMLATKIACTLMDTGSRIGGGNAWYRDGFLLTTTMLKEQSKFCVGEVALDIIKMFRDGEIDHDRALAIASRQVRSKGQDPELLKLSGRQRPCPETKHGTWEVENLHPGGK